MISRLSPFAVVVNLACLTACTSDGRSDWSIDADYGDTAVVVAPRREARPPQLVVGPTPVVTLGDNTGAAFSRISGLDELSSGSIIVADAANLEVTVFSAYGRPVRQVGRTGRGPGEYTSVGQVRVLQGDTILIVAPRERRLLWFDSAGGFIRQAVLDISGPPQLLLKWGAVATRLYSEPLRTGYTRPRSLWAIAYPGDTHQAPDTIGLFRGPGVVRENDRDVRFVQLSPSTYLAAGAEYLWVGDSESYAIRQYDRAGHLIRVIARPTERRRVSEAERAYATMQLRAALSRTRGEYRAEAARVASLKVEVAEFHASFEHLVVDDEDRLWVLEQSTGEAGGQLWAVYDTTGTHLADVIMPIGRDRVWSISGSNVLTTGELRGPEDVPEVRLYRLLEALRPN